MLVIGWNHSGVVNLKNMGSCLENWEECGDDWVWGIRSSQEVVPSDDRTGQDVAM